MRANSQKGFSLLEMLFSVVIMLVASGAAFRALGYYQQNYGSTQLRADMHQGIRGALELMTQEVNQAGLLNFAPRTLSAAVTSSVTAQTVGLNSVDAIFVGEKLVVDTNDFQEEV